MLAERHARPGNRASWPEPQRSRGDLLREALAEDPSPAKRAPAPKDMCKGRRWKEPYQPALRKIHPIWNTIRSCGWWLAWQDGHYEIAWHCYHQEYCMYCGKILGRRITPGDCPEYRLISFLSRS